ncbi:MAG: recombination protein RecR, partial [Pseudomonadota bacterium]
MATQIDKIVYLLSKIPGVGPRSARRALLHLLKYREQLMLPLAEELEKSAKLIKHCQICNNIDDNSPCSI